MGSWVLEEEPSGLEASGEELSGLEPSGLEASGRDRSPSRLPEVLEELEELEELVEPEALLPEEVLLFPPEQAG